MKIGLLLSGLHYRENPVNNINISGYTIDFRYYIKNIKTYIFKLGNIETYIVTNDSPYIGELRAVYNPVELCIMEDTKNRRISKTIKGLELIKESGKIYDYVCVTRLDIYFMKELILNYFKLNIFSELEVPGWHDDNFYFFPFSLLDSFLSLYLTIQDSKDCCADEYIHIGNERYGNHSTIKLDKTTTITFIFDMYEECDIVFNSIEFVKKTQQLFRIK